MSLTLRWLLNTVSVLSLVLCLAMAGSFVWSGFYSCEISRVVNENSESVLGIYEGRFVHANLSFVRSRIDSSKNHIHFDVQRQIFAHYRFVPLFQSMRGVTVEYLPIWWFFILFAALPMTRFSMWMYRRSGYISRRERQKAGLCPVCGYDLRATVGRCPECGIDSPELSDIFAVRDLVRRLQTRPVFVRVSALTIAFGFALAISMAISLGIAESIFNRQSNFLPNVSPLSRNLVVLALAGISVVLGAIVCLLVLSWVDRLGGRRGMSKVTLES